MTVHGYELIGDWKNSTCGKTVRAKKGGRIYFLKQYQTPVMPLDNGTLDAKTFALNEKKFQRFVAYRTRVNRKLRELSGAGGNIVGPSEEFIYGNHYVEASEFVEGVVPDDELEEVLRSLSPDVKKLAMLTAAGALISIHGAGMQHSDLKLKNLMLARNSAGNYVAKLIDFDSSYFFDDIPYDSIIGDINFYSPELAVYCDSEDDLEELSKTLTPKSDIFSLGLIFHFYLAGRLPEAKTLTDKLRRRQEKGKAIYCWLILNNGCELALSPEVERSPHAALIRDMLDADPKKRPTATQVLQRLKSPTPAAGTASRGGTATRTTGTVEEPWPEHNLILDKEKIRASYLDLKKVLVRGEKKYELVDKAEKKSELSRDDLLSRGLASEILVGFATPWPEHSITFCEDKIKSRGFVLLERATLGGVKGYNLRRSDSTAIFCTESKLLLLKYAERGTGAAPSAPADKPSAPAESTPAAPAGDFCAPWPEHAIVFDTDRLKARGYKGCVRKEMAGVKGYAFSLTAGGEQFIRVEMLLMLKLARRV